MGILDTIIYNKQTESISHFKPTDIVKDILAQLKERDRVILTHRYGLEGQNIKTLAAIGQEQNLTRERVRQIEKDLLKNLKKTSLKIPSFASAKDVLINIISEHGKVIAEENLIMHLGIKDEQERNALVFILNLIEELENFIHQNFKKSWVTVLFTEELIHNFLGQCKKVLSSKAKPVASDEFLEHFKQTEYYLQNREHLSDKVILNFLDLAVEIEKNVFGHWGLAEWKEVTPKDVGDKAYLVMKYHAKPEHYSAITEMINKANFDNRTAYKETVHNELIKDSRFILVGRGIYALAEWGYKPGVVADVIKEVLDAAPGGMLSRDKIIEEVLQKRMVKKNTILVGLSNKKIFKKVGKNSYALAEVR